MRNRNDRRAARPLITAVARPLALAFALAALLPPRTAGAQGSGALSVAWAPDGKSFVYQRDDRYYRYDVAAKAARVVDAVAWHQAETAADARRPSAGYTIARGPARAAQFLSAESPDGHYEAIYRDRNLWLRAGTDTTAITTDGSDKSRVKYGTASWVYGEELDQGTAIWWAPSSRKVAFYRFDESATPNYYLALDQVRVQDRLAVEAYPKAGAPNPSVDVLVYDLSTKRTVRLDVRGSTPLTNDAIGYYVYNIRWSPDGSELLLYRTNRLQNTMEFLACDPDSGKCRVILRETWPTGWVTNSPSMQFLKDGKRFLWTSERTGWRNFYLYDLTGTLLATLTHHEFEVGDFLIDEPQGLLYYLARDGDNPMKFQLHRVRLDGSGERRLTDPAFRHSVSIAPGGRSFVDVMETHDHPPVTWLRDGSGKAIAELARPDSSTLAEAAQRRVELFTFKAADSTTMLYGMIHRPASFDSTRKYPVLVAVYAGPGTNGAGERYTSPSGLTDQGYLLVTMDSRSAAGRGKRFIDVIYRRLGTVEVDDQAAGIRALWSRPYVDRTRVGIFGTSYGGYVSIMAMLRHPDVFRAASASSAVTDWRNYDTIYTERYMGLPQDNTEGYDAGSAMRYAANLRGRLLLYYGTADDNVHPSNTLQFIQALQQSGKSFEVQVGPDQQHSAVDRDRMLQFFDERLVHAD